MSGDCGEVGEREKEGGPDLAHSCAIFLFYLVGQLTRPHQADAHNVVLLWRLSFSQGTNEYVNKVTSSVSKKVPKTTKAKMVTSSFSPFPLVLLFANFRLNVL